jgi:hypothetical protein
MKKLFALAFLILMGLILLNRQRVFVRDPLASVYRSAAADGTGAVKQTGVQVYINFSNDILLMKDAQPGAYNLLVQHWNRMPGTPVQLKCIHWMACLTDADHASLLQLRAGNDYDPQVLMSDREVTFLDAQGGRMRVQLR